MISQTFEVCGSFCQERGKTCPGFPFVVAQRQQQLEGIDGQRDAWLVAKIMAMVLGQHMEHNLLSAKQHFASLAGIRRQHLLNPISYYPNSWNTNDCTLLSIQISNARTD